MYFLLGSLDVIDDPNLHDNNKASEEKKAEPHLPTEDKGVEDQIKELK